MNNQRSFGKRLGITPFGLVASVFIIAMAWGLLAIDGLLARAAASQREASADFLEAITQHELNAVRDSGSERDVIRRALTSALQRTHDRPRVVAAVVGADTLFVPDDARGHMVLGAETHRRLLLTGGRSAELLVVSEALARTARTRLWIIGVIGTVLVGIIVVRARAQAAQAAARSADIERLSTEALRANAMKSEFLANVSHELRTPLTAIVGFVEMLRDGVYGDLAARQIGPVDRIAASATHLRQLVDQILDIARIAAGRLEVTREVITLRPYVLNIASELESLFNERSLRLSLSVPQSLPRVRTDPTHLRHILVNLIGNAVKYTPSGGVAVRARLVGAPAQGVRLTPDDPALASRSPDRTAVWVALQVADTGIGIPARDFERIFDEFEQVNAGPRTDSSARGTGLGLAISRRLARALGGDITLESEVGKGSTFTMWIPVDLADLTAAPAPAPTAASEASLTS